MIFDEATSGLDILVAREVLNTIELLRDHGKCILFSSHIMSEVRRLCDRVAILHRGRLLASGTTCELAERYSEPDLEELFYQLVSSCELEIHPQSALV